MKARPQQNTDVSPTIKLDLDEIKRKIAAVAAKQNSFQVQIACAQKVDDILDEVIHTFKSHTIQDIVKWPLIEVEVFIARNDGLDAFGSQATLDLLFINHETKQARIVDWKRVGSLTDGKIWGYAKGHQPVQYITGIKEQLPNYRVDLEYRFYVVDYQGLRLSMVELDDMALHGSQQEVKQRLKLIKDNNATGIWPRNANSCWAYGRPCEFMDRCWPSSGSPELIKLQLPLRSQSLLSEFDLCNRRYAFSLADAEQQGADFHDVGHTNQYAAWGTMFHEGIANCYIQMLNHAPEIRKGV